MHADVEPRRLFEHRLEASRPFDARDLDPVLRAVREAQLRVGKLVQVAGRKSDRREKRASFAHQRTSLILCTRPPYRSRVVVARGELALLAIAVDAPDCTVA